MPRIRTIKPEFPQSESMGRVSREARLLFILLWTLVDDAGRTRAASRMLASLLYPYDDDAPKRIDGWLAELESVDCIVRYQVGDATYLEVRNWLTHQKIDKPSQSKIPPFDEASRILANPREPSSGDLDLDQRIKGPRTKDPLRPRKAADTREIDQVRAVYPKRAGGNPWAKAAKAINARLTEGATWPDLIAGTERYAAFCAATGKVGTEFVKQAATFFGPDRHYLEPWNPPASKPQAKQDANVAASVAWLETRQ